MNSPCCDPTIRILSKGRPIIIESNIQTKSISRADNIILLSKANHSRTQAREFRDSNSKTTLKTSRLGSTRELLSLKTHFLRTRLAFITPFKTTLKFEGASVLNQAATCHKMLILRISIPREFLTLTTLEPTRGLRWVNIR